MTTSGSWPSPGSASPSRYRVQGPHRTHRDKGDVPKKDWVAIQAGGMPFVGVAVFP